MVLYTGGTDWKLTYEDLKNNILDWITTTIPCKNIESYASGLNTSLTNPSWTKDLVTKTYAWEQRKEYNSKKEPTKADKYQTQIKLVATVDSTTQIPVVTKAQIKKDFNEFCANPKVGLEVKVGNTTKLKCLVTTAGLLNFWNNVVGFLYRHLVNVCSNDAPNGALMYWSGSTYSYKFVNPVTNEYLSTTKAGETNISATDILAMLTTLKETYNFAQRTHLVKYKITRVAKYTKTATGAKPSSLIPDERCPEYLDTKTNILTYYDIKSGETKTENK